MQSSSTFVVPKGVSKIDVFCVGGGGGSGSQGSISYSSFSDSGSSSSSSSWDGCSGGGGYTNTVLGVDVEPGQEIAVTVGAGGAKSSYVSFPGNGYNRKGYNGSASSVGDMCTANGGSGNGYGGSAGCGGYEYYQYCSVPSSGTAYFSVSRYVADAYLGAKDGGDTHHSYGSVSQFGGLPTIYSYMMKDATISGQGTTTRYFGESTGTLYSTGGCLYQYPKGDGWWDIPTANTGDGASAELNVGMDGASGICIIRWTKEYLEK